MKVKMTTDYALRVLLLMSTRDGSMAKGELSDELGISVNYLAKVLTRLRVGGLVESERGVNGGYYLTRQPEEITLNDVFVVMNDEVQVQPEEVKGSTEVTGYPQIQSLYLSLQKKLQSQLETVTFAELLS